MTSVRSIAHRRPVVRHNGNKIFSGYDYQVTCNYAVDLYKDIVDFRKGCGMSANDYFITVNGKDIRELEVL